MKNYFNFTIFVNLCLCDRHYGRIEQIWRSKRRTEVYTNRDYSGHYNYVSCLYPLALLVLILCFK